MTTIATSVPHFDMGRVVNRTFGVIGRNLLVFAILALLLAGLPQALVLWSQAAIRLNANGFGAQALAVYGGALVVWIASYLLQAAVIHGTVADLNGQRASLGECFGTGLRHFLPVLAVALGTSIGVGLGLVLLVVPGVLLMLAWIVAVPAQVVERTGISDAFGRSAELTRNHRGAIFGLWVAVVLLSWVVGILAGLVGLALAAVAGGLASAAGATISIVVAAAIKAGAGLIGAVGAGSIYYELRSIKEGIGPEALAAVFD